MRHLIHIGFPKTGSSYLKRWFSAHPQIVHSPNGLAGFANTLEFTAAAARGDNDKTWCVTSSENLSMPRANPGPRWVTDIIFHPEEFREAQERACMRLAEIFPNAYVLIVTRGFRSIILSSYSQYLRQGGIADFDRFICFIIENPWNYDYILALYRRAFCGRVIVLPFELLAGNPRLFRGELERRLEITPFDFPEAKVNASLLPAELRWYPRIGRALHHLDRRNAILRAYVMGGLFDRMGPLISVLNRIYQTPGPGADTIPDRIIDRLRGHAESLKQEPLYFPYGPEYLFSPGEPAESSRLDESSAARS